MQVDNKILDDLARVASGALGALTGLRQEVEAQLRQQFERIISQMDVVPREEFEAVRAMAAAARSEQEVLAERVATLEATLATLLAEQQLAHIDPGPRRRAPGHGSTLRPESGEPAGPVQGQADTPGADAPGAQAH